MRESSDNTRFIFEALKIFEVAGPDYTRREK